MSEFSDWFRGKYHAELPVDLSKPLIMKEPQVFISENLADRLEHPPMQPGFYEDLEAYALAGEWGRGINSYAFYFVEKRGPHRRFFRIFSGGVYGRAEEDAKEVVEYLAGYERWRHAFESGLASSTLICDMGDSSAEWVNPSGERASHRGDDEGRAWWDALSSRMP